MLSCEMKYCLFFLNRVHKTFEVLALVEVLEVLVALFEAVALWFQR